MRVLPPSSAAHYKAAVNIYRSNPAMGNEAAIELLLAVVAAAGIVKFSIVVYKIPF